MGDADFIRKSLFMIGGLIVWAVQFGVIYTFNALACARGFAGRQVLGIGIVPFVVSAVSLVALAATLAVLLAALRRRGPAPTSREERPVDAFLRNTTVAIAALSLVAIAWNAVPAFIVPPCG
jgi:hypothetical protein